MLVDFGTDMSHNGDRKAGKNTQDTPPTERSNMDISYLKHSLAKKAAYMTNDDGDYYYGNPDNTYSDMLDTWTIDQIHQAIDDAADAGYSI